MSAIKEVWKVCTQRTLWVGDFINNYIDGLYNWHNFVIDGRAFALSNLLKHTVYRTGYSYFLDREKHSDNIIFILITTNGARISNALQ